MSSKLSLKVVSKALETLTKEETKVLVLHLGVGYHVLEDIEKQPTPKLGFLHAWLGKEEPSWEKIISGLQEIDKNALAIKIAKCHCAKSSLPSTDPSNSAAVTDPTATPSTSTADSVPIPISVATSSSTASAIQKKHSHLLLQRRTIEETRDEVRLL